MSPIVWRMGDSFIIIIIIFTARTKSTNFHEGGVLSETTLEASVWGLQTTLSGIQKDYKSCEEFQNKFGEKGQFSFSLLFGVSKKF